MHRFAILLISLIAAAIYACQPTVTTPPDDAAATTTVSTAGGGGAAATADAASATATTDSAATTTATGEPSLPAGCVGPQRAPLRCESAGDCYDATTCTQDICDLGAADAPDQYGRRGVCRWEPLPDGAPCDETRGTDVCHAGACCPVSAIPVSTATPEVR